MDAARLTAAIAAGDARAFESLYREWRPRVLALAAALTRRDEATALDITQEVMLKAARRLPVLPDHHAVAAWMTRATLSTARDLLRKERRLQRRQRSASAPHPPPIAADPELLPFIDSLLRNSSPLDYDLFAMHVIRDASLRDAARAAGVSVGLAHGRLWRLLRRLRASASEFLP